MELRLSRRGFLGVLVAAAAAIVVLRVQRTDLRARIREFFALEPAQDELVASELEHMRHGNATGLAATTAFFALDGGALRPLVPDGAARAVVIHWSRILLGPRSVGWPWLGYPSTTDVPVCDGLVKTRA
jgi:hypothetical protein